MNKVKVIHLYLLNKCTNKCPLCCNLLYDIDKLPVVTVEELKSADTVCFTGGDPFLASLDINLYAAQIRKQYPNIKNVYAYTSGMALFSYLQRMYRHGLDNLTGISVCPKSSEDWECFNRSLAYSCLTSLASNRLYVFKGQAHKEVIERAQKLGYDIIGRVWQKEFNTPDNEIFRRLPVLLDK